MTEELDLLRAGVKRHGSSEVARKLHVSEGSVRGWMAGTSSPRRKACVAIIAAFGPAKEIPKESRGAKGASLPLSRPPDERAKGEVNDHDDPRANAVATLHKLRGLLDEVPPERVHSVANAITASSRLLAKITGQTDVSETMLLRSMAWARIKTAIVEAVRPYPEAARAVADALEQVTGS